MYDTGAELTDFVVYACQQRFGCHY